MSEYWDAFHLHGAEIEFQHLDPFVFSCDVPDGDIKTLLVNTRFSNHCFTEAFDEARHEPDLVMADHKNRRAFSRIRYDLSKNLPEIVRRLPDLKVHQTPEKRNYMYFSAVAELPDQEYRLFFHLKRADKSAKQHLELFVESAYPAMGGALKRKRPGTIRFALLALKTYRGEPVRFAAR